MKPGTEINKISWCQNKWGHSANKMLCAKGIFIWWGLCISSFRAITYVMNKQSCTCRTYLLLQGLCVPSVRTTTYVYNRLNTSFCTKKPKTHQAIFCYSLLYQTTSREGKNSLKECRDILVSDRDPERFFFIILP